MNFSPRSVLHSYLIPETVFECVESSFIASIFASTTHMPGLQSSFSRMIFALHLMEILRSSFSQSEIMIFGLDRIFDVPWWFKLTPNNRVLGFLAMTRWTGVVFGKPFSETVAITTLDSRALSCLIAISLRALPRFLDIYSPVEIHKILVSFVLAQQFFICKYPQTSYRKIP